MPVPPSAGGGDARLEALLTRAAQRAHETGRRVLVSLTEEAGACDPLAVLARLERDRSAEERMYWSRPARNLAISAIGAAATLAPGGAGRFRAVDREWRKLLEGAIVHDVSGGAPGAGPLLVGGFSFDEDGPRTPAWSGFPAALMFVPRMQVARSDAGSWLTMTVLVSPDGTPDVEPAALAAMRARVLGASSASGHSAHGTGGSLHYAEVPAPDEWRALVRGAVAEIARGSLEKVVVAREVRASASQPIGIVATLRHLRASHPDCYVFGLWRGDAAFVGASPERLVRVDGREVRASTLAGSIRRGSSAAEDRTLAERLLGSEKDLSEHEVVRRALCGALAQICDDVISEHRPSLLTLPQVHHLHTVVHARLRGGHSPLDLVALLHPTPAVGGAPREAALRFLRDHETLDRGWYAAPIGWLQANAGEFAVALRSALVRGADASLYAGCGVVEGSDPEREYAESRLKLAPMELALAAALAADAEPGVDTREPSRR